MEFACRQLGRTLETEDEKRVSFSLFTGGQPRASSRAGTRPQIIKWTAEPVSYRFQVRLPPLIRTLKRGEDPLCSVNQQKVRLVVVKTPEGTANTHAKVEWKARNAAQNLVRKWITLLLALCLGRTLWLRPEGWYMEVVLGKQYPDTRYLRIGDCEL